MLVSNRFIVHFERFAETILHAKLKYQRKSIFAQLFLIDMCLEGSALKMYAHEKIVIAIQLAADAGNSMGATLDFRKDFR